MIENGLARSRKSTILAALFFAVATLIFLIQVLQPASGEALGGFDVRGLFWPWLTFARDAVMAGRLPMWDASQFAGYPFLSNPQVALFYPPNWLAVILPTNIGISWYVVFHIWLAGFGMFQFARLETGSFFGAVLSGLTFGFSGFFAARIEAGHIGLIAVYSWLPWLLLATSWSVANRRAAAGIITGIPFGLAILAGHTTSLIYFCLIWLFFVLYLSWRVGNWPLVWRQALIAGTIGLALSCVQLLPLLEFGYVSSRASTPSLEFASAYSLPPAHLVTLLVPEYFGEPTRTGYWSVPNFEELTYYAGILPIVGLVVSLRKPSKRTWFFLSIGILGMLIAFGNYGFVFPIVYKVIPIFRLTRAPGRAAFLYTFAAAVLLADSVAKWEAEISAEEIKRLYKYIFRFVVITAVTGIAIFSAVGAVFTLQHPTETSGRLWHQLGGLSLAIIFLLVGAILFWLYITQKRKRRWISAAIITLVIIDLWHFGFKLVRLDSMAPDPLWVDAKNIIGETDWRVLPWGISIFEQNGAGQVGLNSIFGYNALEVGANVAFTESIPDPRSTAYDILSAGFVVANVPLERFSEGERPLTLIDHTDSVWVYQRNRPLPIVRLVTEVELIDEDSQAIARVHQPDFDPLTTVILNQQPDCDLDQSLTVDDLGTAIISERRNGYWRIETNNPAPAMLVLSETYYPGWRVTVSNRSAKILKAYTAVRAICVPPGDHVVEMVYTPIIYILGGLISAVGLIVVIAAVIWLKKRPNSHED